MGRTGKEAYTQEYSVITKAWQRFVGLSGLENSTSLLIDFRIADYKSKTPEESWDLNSVPNEPHTFRDNITGKRKGFKVKAMKSRCALLESWYKYQIDDVKRHAYQKAGFFDENGKTVPESLFQTMRMTDFMNSLRNSIWLQVVSIGGQEVPSVCWFSESKSVPRSLRFQGVSPLPNPTYFWSSTLISRRDMYDSWENSSSEYFKVPYHYFIKNEHGHQKYSYESDTGAAWGVGVLTFRSQNTVELPVPIESVYFEFIRNVPGPANRCSFVKQHPGSEQQNRRIIADIKDENARTSNADLLGSLMQYF